jgi:hypothetical protein
MEVGLSRVLNTPLEELWEMLTWGVEALEASGVENFGWDLVIVGYRLTGGVD